LAWPFSAAAPSLDSGEVATVPTVATAVPNVTSTGTQTWLMGADFFNTTNEPITVTLTDGSNVVFRTITIQAGSGPDKPIEWAFRPTVGVKWFASAAGLNGKIWGYQ
jgi:hypothetical protein